MEYYELTKVFPESNWQPGRFIGIDWLSGDAFTYLIWKEKDGSWEGGHEIMRDVICSRKVLPPSAQTSIPKETYEKLELLPEQPDRRRKRSTSRKCRETRRILESIPVHGNYVLTEVHLEVLKDFPTENSEEEDVDNLPYVPDAPDSEIPCVDSAFSIAEQLKTKPADQSSLDPIPPDYDPLDSTGDCEMVNEVSDTVRQALHLEEEQVIGGAKFLKIVGHMWQDGRLKFTVLWTNDEFTTEDAMDLREDFTQPTAQYIIQHKDEILQ